MTDAPKTRAATGCCSVSVDRSSAVTSGGDLCPAGGAGQLDLLADLRRRQRLLALREPLEELRELRSLELQWRALGRRDLHQHIHVPGLHDDREEHEFPARLAGTHS